MISLTNRNCFRPLFSFSTVCYPIQIASPPHTAHIHFFVSAFLTSRLLPSFQSPLFVQIGKKKKDEHFVSPTQRITLHEWFLISILLSFLINIALYIINKNKSPRRDPSLKWGDGRMKGPIYFDLTCKNLSYDIPPPNFCFNSSCSCFAWESSASTLLFMSFFSSYISRCWGCSSSRRASSCLLMKANSSSIFFVSFLNFFYIWEMGRGGGE